MASEQSSAGDHSFGRSIPPAKRRRLQQCFEQANQLMARGNHDYANELFSQCVVGDPSNMLYLQGFMANLKQKYNNNKKGNNMAFLKLAGLRRSVSKAIKHEDWEGAFKAGTQALAINPWDVPTLKHMSEATELLDFDEVQLVYLKTALDAKPKDPDVNRLCAKALTDRGQFDQAIACWRRVEQANPKDPEAERQIADLAVKKTIHDGGYEEADAGKKVSRTKRQPEDTEMSLQRKLELNIQRHPDEIPLYYELAELHVRDENFDKAEEVLGRAYEASGQNADVRERLEDMQIRNLRQKRAAAEKKLKATGSEEDKQAFKEIDKALDAKEVQVYEHRCEHHPNNLAFKYFLGLKYQGNGLYDKAIHQFQLAKNDPQRKGLCMLALGQCFQQIKQYRLAMTHYEEGIQDIPERDAENRKKALYLAGKLALGLKNVDTAEKHLTALAGVDFAYKDVSSLLDKISQLREDEGESKGS
jgi:tetratricopeptide (TPR) repeat protein